MAKSNNRFPVGNKENMKRKKLQKDNVVPKHSLTSILGNAGFTREMVERKVADILLMNTKETREMKVAEDTCNFDLIVISVTEAAQRNADCNRMDNLLDKIFGKTIRIDGNIKVENVGDGNAMNNADAELIQRAMERALRNSQV